MDFKHGGKDKLFNMGDSLKIEHVADKWLKATFGAFTHTTYKDSDWARKRGFDYIVRNGDDSIKLAIEDKADLHTARTGNIAIELFTLSPTRRCSVGWYYYSEAAVLRYVSFESQEVILVLFAELRAFVAERGLASFGSLSAANTNRHTGELTHISFNALVPVADLKKLPSTRVTALEGSTGTLARRHPELVASAEEAVRVMSKAARGYHFSRSIPPLDVPGMQQRIETNRRLEQHDEYIAQCILPDGLTPALAEASHGA